MSYTSFASYLAEIEAWRKQRESDLRAPDGVLSQSGLFFLADGRHTIGSSADNAILLPPNAPSYLGEIDFHQGKTSLTVTTDATVLVDGAPTRQARLIDNSNRQTPTIVATGTVSFFVHHFNDNYALRVKDSSSPAIQAFPGCEWFAVKPTYHVIGQFRPAESPRAIPIDTVANRPSNFKSVGTVEFKLAGEPLSFAVTDTGNPQQLSTILRDATSGKTTHGGGRFLTLDVNEHGTALIDFNKTYNPPCAFSPYTSCPLPPAENILPVAIEAGERYTPQLQAYRAAVAAGLQVA